MKKNLVIILLIVVIAVAGCNSKEQGVAEEEPGTAEKAGTVEEKPGTAEKQEIVEEGQEMAETVTPVKTEVKYTRGSELVSNISCVNDQAIRLTLTNIENSTWTIADDVVFYLNTVVDSTPECDREALAPGQSTVCTLDSADIGLTPSIVVKTPENKDVRKVSCSEN